MAFDFISAQQQRRQLCSVHGSCVIFVRQMRAFGAGLWFDWFVEKSEASKDEPRPRHRMWSTMEILLNSLTLPRPLKACCDDKERSNGWDKPPINLVANQNALYWNVFFCWISARCLHRFRLVIPSVRYRYLSRSWPLSWVVFVWSSPFPFE